MEHDEAKVVNRGGRGLERKVRDANEKSREQLRENLGNSSLVQSSKELAGETGTCCMGLKLRLNK